MLFTALHSALVVAALASPTKDQISQWVKDLGDANFEVRERASRQLWEAGEAAEAAVLEATRSSDAEVARRAGDLADKFRWGIYPSTPPKVVELVGRYREADANGKLATVRALLDTGAPGCTTLLKIARAEKDAALRQRLLGQIGQEASRAVPGLLAEGSFTSLEALLELSIEADADAAMSSYAAYWLVRGKLKDVISRWKGQATGPHAKRANEVLTYLYRAQGDLVAARDAAEKTGKADLLEEVLYQQGDWKTLATRQPANGLRRDIEALGYRAAYQRLAGDTAAFERTVAEIRKHTEVRPENDGEIWSAAKALFLNNRPADGLSVLGKSSRHVERRFDILAAQNRQREAFALADAVKANDPEKPLVEVLRARLLFTLGEKDRALTIFARLADAIKEGDETYWSGRLVLVEQQLGLRELALQHCGRVLAASRSPARALELLSRLFPGHDLEPWALWELLRRMPGGITDTTAATKRLADLFSGKPTEKELTALAERAGEKSVTALPFQNYPEHLLLGLATVAEAAKHDALAMKFLEQAAAKGSASALLRLGDRLAERKDWTAAAARYAEAWNKDTSDPLPLYLRGHALAMAGQGSDGSLWMARASLLPLGNEPVRQALADALQKRGHLEAARREREIITKTGLPGSFYAGDALRESALDAAARHDYVRAADLHEKSMLRCLDARVSFQESGAYAAVPAAIHRYRALGLLKAGRLDEARKEMALCEAAMPGDVDLPCGAVPMLERLGLKAEADDLFDRTWAIHEKLGREYPNSAREHNSLGWLSACCRRDLDQGLQHAQKAVSLTPDSASVHDTLGEIQFQRGDRDKALAEARRSIELAPKSPYYRRQLKRIEAGDPRAELPPQGDE
jgi:tetratricopeptide (TPR) repeat protein